MQRKLPLTLQSAPANTAQWNDQAYLLLQEFLHEVNLFQCEDFRKYCVERGLAMPTHLRSFAAIIVRARRAGLITHAGYDKVENTKAHHAMANVWRPVVRTAA